ISELGIADIPRLTVYNKSDQLGPETIRALSEQPNSLVISARDRESLRPLMTELSHRFPTTGWKSLQTAPEEVEVSSEERFVPEGMVWDEEFGEFVQAPSACAAPSPKSSEPGFSGPRKRGFRPSRCRGGDACSRRGPSCGREWRSG